MVRLPPKYYLCVTQEISQMAWASPVWLEAGSAARQTEPVPSFTCEQIQ